MKYPETGLPGYLQHDLDAYKEGIKNNSPLLDCLWGELYGSINAAQIDDGAISPEHADYLRKKYLFPHQYEMQREDLRIDDDLQVSDDGCSVMVYLETWFDAEKKFQEDLSDDETWLNLYATYDPFADTLKMGYVVETATHYFSNDYQPTEGEERLVKDMITEKIRELYHQTSQEFCQDAGQDNSFQMEGHI